jgi:protein dpy-30
MPTYNYKLHYHEPGNPPTIQSAKNSLETIPIRSYLDQTVVPLVLQALSALAQEKNKPENPIDYVAEYLLKHNPEDKQAHQ